MNSAQALGKSLKYKARKLLENYTGTLDDLESISDFLDTASKIDEITARLSIVKSKRLGIGCASAVEHLLSTGAQESTLDTEETKTNISSLKTVKIIR